MVFGALTVAAFVYILVAMVTGVVPGTSPCSSSLGKISTTDSFSLSAQSQRSVLDPST